MENVFIKYFTKPSLLEPIVKRKELGPVITISRDFGCDALSFANKIKEKLNSKPVRISEWMVINKEILEKSAKALNSSPHMISHLFNAEERGFYADIIESFSGKYYLSDQRIKNTISRVIKEYGEEGNVIIIGRGGFIFTRHINKSIHIKLTAPFEWRVNNIAEKYNLSLQVAKMQVAEIDEKRNKFLHLFKSHIDDCNDFDVVFNLRNTSRDEIIEMLMIMIETRGI